jgi:cyclophilin family peptidyl-prolyl cis-trans isomerase
MTQKQTTRSPGGSPGKKGTPGSPARVERCEQRQLLAAPAIAAMGTIVVPLGKTYQVPLVSNDPEGKSVRYEVVQTAGIVAVQRPSTNTWVDMSTSLGSMRFMLFDDASPKTVRRIKGLIQAGFYDGQAFHRVINDFVAQAGDPLSKTPYVDGGTLRDPRDAGDNVWGTGGPDFRFDDEFSPDLTFTGYGQLAMANGGKDTNGSQFFITDRSNTSLRGLDFNHTIFGQLVRGFDTFEKILATPTSANSTSSIGKDMPVNDVKINTVRIASTQTDAVLQIKGVTAPGNRDVVVRAIDADGESVSTTIRAQVVADAIGTPPILSPLNSVYFASPGSSFELVLNAIDLEGEQLEIGANIISGGTGVDTVNSLVDQNARRIVMPLNPGFTGQIELLVGVKTLNALSRGSTTLSPGDPPTSLKVFDTQKVTIAVGDRPIRSAVVENSTLLQMNPTRALTDTVVGRFTSDNAAATASDFAAEVDWGDGVVSSGRIRLDSAGVFSVIADKTYSASGTLPLTTIVSGAKGAEVTIEGFADVRDIATITDGRVAIAGTNANDTISLVLRDNELRINVNGLVRRYALPSVRSIDLASFDGNDIVTLAIDIPSISAQLGGGDDQFYAGAGNDTVDAGAGNDYVSGSDGNDLIRGGDGEDTLSAGAGRNQLYGDADADRLNGSGGRDFLDGGSGDDRLYGQGGDDTLFGGSNVDRLFGGSGNDLLRGGNSNDKLYGESGNDTLLGDAGIDLFDGGPDVDQVDDDVAGEILTSIEG